MSKNKVAALMLALFCAILLFIKLVLLDIQLQSSSLFLDLAFLLLLISLTIFNLVRYKDIFLEKNWAEKLFLALSALLGLVAAVLIIVSLINNIIALYKKEAGITVALLSLARLAQALLWGALMSLLFLSRHKKTQMPGCAKPMGAALAAFSGTDLILTGYIHLSNLTSQAANTVKESKAAGQFSLFMLVVAMLPVILQIGFYMFADILLIIRGIKFNRENNKLKEPFKK